MVTSVVDTVTSSAVIGVMQQLIIDFSFGLILLIVVRFYGIMEVWKGGAIVEWISVNDHLPKMMDRVNVLCEHANYVGSGYLGFDGEFYEVFARSWMGKNVTHWMPLPNQSK